MRSYLERPTSAVLAGVSGVGKTRLAREVLAGLAADGRPSHWVSATGSSQHIPLGVLGPLLVGDRPPLSNPLEALGEMRRALEAEGSCERPLVAVDDAHLVDEGSAMVLHQLVVSGAATLLAVVRTGEATPDAVTALWKDGWAERVDLQALSRSETDDLVIETLGSRCGALVLYSLWQASLGSPLYVGELIRGAQFSGVLARVGGIWQLSGPLPVVGRLAELIKVRIGRLTSAARNELDVVALAEPVPIEVIEGWTDVVGLAEAERAGLIEMVPEGDRTVVRVTHPMFGEVVRSLLPGARRRSLAARLADGYARAETRRRDDLLQCVAWRLESGESGPPEMLVAGARLAIESLDFRLAERLARSARSAAPGDLDATLVLAESLYRQQRFEHVVDELDKFESLDDAQLAAVAVLKAKALWFGLHDTAAAEAVLAATDSALAATSSRAWLVAFRARLLVASGFASEALLMAVPVAEDPSHEAPVTLAALGAVAMASAFSGRVSIVLAAERRWREPRLAAAAQSQVLSDWGPIAAWVATFLAGQTDRAGSMGSAYLDLGLQQRNARFVAAGSIATGWVELSRGNALVGAGRLSEGWEVLRTADWSGMAILAAAGLVMAQAFCGDVDRARATLAAAQAARHEGLRWFDPLLEISEAWVEAADGHVASAVGKLREVAVLARERGQFAYEVHALHGVARLGHASEVAARLSALVLVVEGPLAPVVAAHAGALAASDPAGLAVVSDAFEGLGMQVLAAEAARTAARRYQVLGKRSLAASLDFRCEALLSGCVGAVSPVLETLRSSSMLTSRELEVARLAARGRSSRQIAEQLTLSVRTVETHLAHAYTRLGVAGRRGLAETLGAALPPPPDVHT